MKEYIQAETALVSSLAKRVSALGDDHNLVANTYLGLGEIYLLDGRLDDAKDALEKCIKVRLALGDKVSGGVGSLRCVLQGAVLP